MLALIALTGIGLGTGFGVKSLTGAGQAVLVGVPALPTTIEPIALTGDPKAADPCALIDLAWLHQFGNPSFVTPEILNGCRVQITTPNGDNAILDVTYRMPATVAARIGDQHQQLSALTILREHIVQSAWDTECENVLVLADNTRVSIEALGHNGFDRCKLAEVGTANAVNALASHGIVYSPSRTNAWPIARSDACTLLTNTKLSSLGGVDPTIRTLGYANWWCAWGASTAAVSVQVRLDGANLTGSYGKPTTIADHRAWLQLVTYTNPHQCIATVVSHPARSLTDTTQIIMVTAQAAQPDQTLCTRHQPRRHRHYPRPHHLTSTQPG